MKMRDQHCHSHQHVVTEIARGVCPQEVSQIIANICLPVYVYVFTWTIHAIKFVIPDNASALIYVSFSCACEGAICVHTHTFPDCLFPPTPRVSPFRSVPLSSTPDRLLNVRPNTNRASVCPSVRLSVCFCLCVCACSSPANQNERPS